MLMMMLMMLMMMEVVMKLGTNIHDDDNKVCALGVACRLLCCGGERRLSLLPLRKKRERRLARIGKTRKRSKRSSKLGAGRIWLLALCICVS